MAISNSYDWNLTRTEIISDALRIVGALGEWETASTTRLSRLTSILNGIIKMKQQIGMPLWKMSSLGLPITSFTGNVITVGGGTAEIVVAKPLKLYSAWLCNYDLTISRRELDIVGRREFLGGAPNYTTGSPHSIYMSPLREYSEFWVSPVPSDYAIANEYVEIHYQSEISDVDSSSDNIDFPPEWLLLITYELADVAAAMYGTPVTERQMISAKLKDLRRMAEEFDVEEGSLIIKPNYRG